MASYLDNGSVKNLRLTCRLFGALKLRIDRVFITPNTKDIQTLYAIAESDVYRPKVVEVIYDDAWVENPLQDYSSMESLPFPQTRNFHMSHRLYKTDTGSRFKRRRGQCPEDRSSSSTSKCRMMLMTEQEDNIARGVDAEALRYALGHFPALQRITVTPATSGLHCAPLYETPANRAASLVTNGPKPVDRASRTRGHGAYARPWGEDRKRWRGYNMVTKLLAEEKHHRVSEFVIDTHFSYKGLNCRLFEQPCDEYHDFKAILQQQPGLKKLQLSLHISGQERQDLDWSAFNNHLLRDALAEASQLEHFSMETDWQTSVMERSVCPPTLQTFLPIERWAGLQHFRLHSFPLRSANLISALSQLTSLQSLELAFLYLCEREDNHHDLLNGMRGTLRLHERPVRPKVRLGVPLHQAQVSAPGFHPDSSDLSPSKLAVWLDREVEAFFYSGGENPFAAGKNALVRAMGVVKDAFDPGVCETL